MVTQSAPADVAFAGTGDEPQLAARLFGLLNAHGRFMAADAPIRLPAAALAEFLSRGGTAVSAEAVSAAAAANPAVFALEGEGEAAAVVTTRGGHPPTERPTRSAHDFAKRFLTPLPKPEVPPQPARVRVRVDPSWATLSVALDGLEAEEEAGDGRTDVLPPAATAPTAPAALSTELATRVPAPDVAIVPPVVEVEPAVEVAAPAPFVPAASEPVVPAAPEPVVPSAAEPEPEPEPVRAPVPEVPAARTVTVMKVSTTDVSGVDDRDLAAAISERLRNDIRIANFGEQWLAEDRVPRFSRGDLRRMKDYIQEQEQPLTDDLLVQDVLGFRPNAPDFDLMRFAVNFRLSREHREFEFVGTANQRFWSTSSLPQIGTTRRKPNELGTDYRYALEELAPEPDYRSVASVDHVVTFFEYYHGLLPYDARMQALLPGPLLPDQRTAVLTFETPQSYTTYLVELRYPTPNRGGFILGLDDFFSENLVPGALITISRTENDGHYRVEYLAAGNQSARLLELDERRALRYVFRPTTYACAADDDWLLTEDRFPRLGSEKPLDDKVRRRPEAVVATTFERIGDNSDGPGFSADLADLLAAANIERPFSERVLRNILETDETGAFARDTDKTDAYTYVPGSVS